VFETSESGVSLPRGYTSAYWREWLAKVPTLFFEPGVIDMSKEVLIHSSKMIASVVFRYGWAFLSCAFASILLSAQTSTSSSASTEPPDLPAVTSVLDCSALASADISQAVGGPTQIKSASLVNEGKTPYCQIKAEIEGNINFEVRLPSSWTQRLLFGGGLFQLPSTGIEQFAVAFAEDLGHRGHEDVFRNNYQLRVNYGYRGVHLVTLAAKELVARYYKQAPKFSYYAGCSEPGRQGMQQVERFPEDFNGVIVGCAPITTTTNNSFYNAWQILKNTRADGTPILTVEKLPILHKAVLDQCDASDGLKDGLISDPFSCHPDITVVECKPGQNPDSCLSSEQVRVAQEIYKGAHDTQGKRLVAHGPLPGSELAWVGYIVVEPNRNQMADQMRKGTELAIRDLFSDPTLPETFKLSDLKFDRATFDSLTKLRTLYDGTNPDLSTFHKLGHKLILWHGLNDVAVPPSLSISLFEAMRKQMGASATDDFVRFYLFPGVNHCGGGEGPLQRDLLTPLIAWVERGVTPGVLLASHVPGAGGGFAPPPPPNAVADRTRPVYPYPYTAQYRGKGSIDDAANFEQGPAQPTPTDLFNWLGAGFYAPGYEKWCTGNGTILQCKESR